MIDLVNRERWIIQRTDTNEVFCGVAKHYYFKPIEDIGETCLKTYRSEKQALSAFRSSWSYPTFEVRAIKVKERIIFESECF